MPTGASVIIAITLLYHTLVVFLIVSLTSPACSSLSSSSSSRLSSPSKAVLENDVNTFPFCREVADAKTPQDIFAAVRMPRLLLMQLHSPPSPACGSCCYCSRVWSCMCQMHHVDLFAPLCVSLNSVPTTVFSISSSAPLFVLFPPCIYLLHSTFPQSPPQVGRVLMEQKGQGGTQQDSEHGGGNNGGGGGAGGGDDGGARGDGNNSGAGLLPPIDQLDEVHLLLCGGCGEDG